MSQSENQNPATPVVLLGASNLTMGFPLILENLLACLPNPVDVFAALGHGRSFGMWSRVLFRHLPGILQSELWSHLKDRTQTANARPKLLITDIGNDLIYGAPVPNIMNWIEECLERVKATPGETVLTLPPVDSIDSLSRWRFRLMKSLIFPGRKVSLEEIRQSAHDLANHIEALGKSHGIAVVRPERTWYGIDPIHLRKRYRSESWKTILSHWSGFDVARWGDHATSPIRREFRQSRFAHRRIFGRDHFCRQPACQTERFTLWLS